MLCFANLRPEVTHFLAWTIGGAIDEFFAAMSRQVRRMPDDAASMQGLMAQFGVRPMGPPPAQVAGPREPARTST